MIPLTAFWYLSDPAFNATSDPVILFLLSTDGWALEVAILWGYKLTPSGLPPVGKSVVGYLFPS